MSWGAARIVGHGTYDELPAQVDPQNRALRVSLRPREVGVYGAYSLAVQSGVMAAGLAAQSPIFEFRWPSSSVIALIERVSFSAVNDGTAFAITNTSCLFDLVRASAFTATDATGSQNIVIGGTNKRANRMAGSTVQQAATTYVVASSTATLSAGAKTLEAQAMHEITGTGLGAGTLIAAKQNLVDPTDTSKWPFELNANEGFVIRATVAATGTWRFSVEVDWSEVDPARYYGFAS